MSRLLRSLTSSDAWHISLYDSVPPPGATITDLWINGSCSLPGSVLGAADCDYIPP